MKRKALLIVGIFVGMLICSIEFPSLLEKSSLLEISRAKAHQISSPITPQPKKPVHSIRSI